MDELDPSLPREQFITDLFAHHPAIEKHPELFAEVIKQYQSVPKPIPLQSLDGDLKSINKQITENLSTRIIKHGGKEAFFYTHPKTFKEEPLTSDIALLIHNYLNTVVFNSEIYSYDDARGIFENNVGRIFAAIDTFCNVCEQRTFIPRLQLGVVNHLKGIEVFQDYPFDRSIKVIPFENACVKYNGKIWSTEKHSSLHKFTWRLPIKYNPIADPQQVYTVLEQWVDTDDVPFLIQIPAQSLLQMGKAQPYKKSYLLSGGRDAAKSTYINMLQRFFGDPLICAVPLQDIGTRFTNSVLEGRALNIFDDLPDSALKELGRFKAMTGSFRHDIERKHQLTYSGFINAVHVFTCNRPPKVPDPNDEAFWSRWEYIVFPNSFPRNASWFEETITQEWLSAFANLVLNEYIRILDKGLLAKNTPVMVRDAWLSESSSEYQFVRDCLKTGMDYSISTDECYALYQKWCHEKGRTIHDQRIFGRDIARMGISKERPQVGDKRIHKYIGIGLDTTQTTVS